MKTLIPKPQPWFRPLLLSAVFLASYACHGQLSSFSFTYPGGSDLEARIYGVHKTLNNKLLTVGTQASSTGLVGGAPPQHLRQYEDMRLLQTNLDGDVLFTRILSTPYDDRAFDAVRANLGDMLVVGHSGQGYTMADRRHLGVPPDTLNAAVAIVRINPAGVVVTQRHFDLGGFDDHAFSIVRKANESYFILGRSYRSPYDKYVITFMNTNSNGQMQSASIIHDNYASNLLPCKVIRTGDGGFLIAATKEVDGASDSDSPDPIVKGFEGTGIILIKLDINENIVFSSYVAPVATGSYYMNVRDIIEDQNNNVFIVGMSTEGDYLMKMNSAGSIVKAKTFDNTPGLMDITPYCIAQNGSTIVVSGISAGVGVPRAVFDANLNLLSAQMHENGEAIYSIENVAGGLQYYGGTSFTAVASMDGMLLKLTNGVPMCEGVVDTLVVQDFPYTQQLISLYKQPTPFAELGSLDVTPVNVTRGVNCNVMAKTNVDVENADNTIFTPTLSPNPAHDQLQLNLPGDGRSELQLLDLQGRLLREASLPAGQHSLPVSDLESGVYLLRIQGPGGLSTHKLSIQH